MMIAPLKKKDDIKIFILYLLHNLNKPLEFEDINAIVMQDGVVGGIDEVGQRQAVAFRGRTFRWGRQSSAAVVGKLASTSVVWA